MTFPTALVVPVPEAEHATGQWRRAHTKGGRRGMPSHITIVSPWVPYSPIDYPVERLNSAVLPMVPFAFDLVEIGTFPKGVLFVSPTATGRFVELIEVVCGAFPEYQPYGGEFAPGDVIPHLTIAVADAFPNGSTDADEAVFKLAAAAVEPLLPIRCVAHELCVFYDDGDAWQAGPGVSLV